MWRHTAPVPVSGTHEAELTKLLENTFRHVNIALVNELAMFAAELGIDVWEAIDAASTKPFGYLRFTPGPLHTDAMMGELVEALTKIIPLERRRAA